MGFGYNTGNTFQQLDWRQGYSEITSMVTGGTTGITNVLGQNIGTGTGLIFANAIGATSYYRKITGVGKVVITTVGNDIIVSGKT